MIPVKIIFVSLPLFGLLWLVWPWGPFVGAFVGMYGVLWILAFLSFLGISARRVVAAVISMSPFFIAVVYPPSLAAGPLSLLAALFLFTRAAWGRYGWYYGGLRGLAVSLLYVFLVHATTAFLMVFLDLFTGLASRANEVGLHPYQRWEVAVFLSTSGAFMIAASYITTATFSKIFRQGV